MSFNLNPPTFWVDGTDPEQPWNDNALRQLISNASVNNSTTAQPALTSPADDGKCYIIQSTHTGAQWAAFTPKSIAVFYGGGWYEGKPTEGFRISVGGAPYIYTSGAWTIFSSGASDMFSPLTGAEISVTAAATATLGRMHVCSGTSADYALTLPAASGNAGKFVGVRISSACTRWITVTGNGAELIDGSNTRRMWQRESAILMCDGTGWTKVAGKSIPIKAAAIRSTTYNVTSGTWDIIPVNSSLFDNTSALAVPALDLTAGRIRVLRAGEYQLSGRVSVTGVTAQRLFAGGAVCGNFTAGPGPLSPGAWSSAAAPTGGVAGGFCYGSGSTVFSAATSQFFYTTCFLDDTTTRATNTGTDTAPFVAVAELPSW